MELHPGQLGMRIALNTPARKAALLAPVLVLAIIFIAVSGASFLASIFINRPTLQSHERAMWLQPGNAELAYQTGLQIANGHFSSPSNPSAALKSLQSATILNPHRSNYWLALASACRTIANCPWQNDVAKAVVADPTNPGVAWEAANLYMSTGQNDKALQQFKIVIANDPLRISPALERSWRLWPNAPELIHNLLPRRAEAYFAFLELMLQQNQPDAAATTWDAMQELGQPVSQRAVLDYVRYLLTHNNIQRAKLVWEQSATLAGLADYQPSRENLIVNGGFDLPILNGGFDWLYGKLANVTLQLDTVQFHSAPRSLMISFDKAQISDAGIQHLVLVNPDTNYDFFASYKTENLRGAGGLIFTLQDAVDGSTIFTSDELTGADFWKETDGSFSTGPNSRLLILRMQRIPAGNVIEGSLWVDDVRLAEHAASSAENFPGQTPAPDIRKARP